MYQLVVNHANWINSVTPGALFVLSQILLNLLEYLGFPGAVNDKMGVRYDAYIERLRTDPLFTNYEYPLYDSQGNVTMNRGAWAIVDSGYHQWKVSQAPAPYAPSLAERSLSKIIVENRKDSEVTIGRMRSRFRVLRMPFLCKTMEQIDATVHTAAIVHNMLLEHDGLAARFDDVDAGFELNDVNANADDDVDGEAEDGWRPVHHHNGDIVGPMDDFGGRGIQLQRAFGAEKERGYDSFREKLVQHAHFMYRNRAMQHNH